MERRRSVLVTSGHRTDLLICRQIPNGNPIARSGIKVVEIVRAFIFYNHAALVTGHKRRIIRASGHCLKRAVYIIDEVPAAPSRVIVVEEIPVDREYPRRAWVTGNI